MRQLLVPLQRQLPTNHPLLYSSQGGRWSACLARLLLLQVVTSSSRLELGPDPPLSRLSSFLLFLQNEWLQAVSRGAEQRAV